MSVSAQNVSGKWYGVGKVKKAGDHNSYLSEMILKQKGNRVTGEYNYFYRSAEIKTKVTGRYNPKYKVLELDPQPMLNFLAKNSNGADCPMEGSFTLKITKGTSTLTGQFNPTPQYSITCPAIDVKFTKSVPKADSKIKDNEDEDTTTAPAEIKKPIAVNKIDTIKKAVSIDKAFTPKKIDSTAKPVTVRVDTGKKSAVIVRPPIIQQEITPEQQISLLLKMRSFDETPVLEVDADSLKVALYDNGEVDNDTISLFFNRKLVATKLMLSDKPLNFAFALNNGVNEIAMFAENLGRIPPNTALAVIYAGDQRFELNLTSTLSKNASIRFRRKVKHEDPKNVN